MIAAFLTIGGIGLIAGLGLAVASKVFYVYVDPKIVAIEEALPGANCGGCGYPGCSGAASAIVRGESPPNACVAGGSAVHNKIASLLGVEIKEAEPEIALPGCTYGVDKADLKYIYDGFDDCRAAVLLSGGAKECPIGCLGLGTCVRACPFDALSMGPDSLPVVNTSLCTGCGTCERVCPKNIITLSSATRRIIEEYVTDECTAPCQRACPTGIDIPRFIREITFGRYREALLTIKEKCALPLVCGYICPAPCELSCRRNFVDEGVAINPLKRFVSDYERKTGEHIEPYKNPYNGMKIALIGGGAEGLSAAYYLARLGYRPTLIDAKPQLGGILRYVISEDRLPRKVLDHDIQGILRMGVEARLNMVMGRDFNVNTLLKEGFDAVVLTSGGFDSRKILVPDQKRFAAGVAGVHIMLDILTKSDQDRTFDTAGHAVIVDSTLKGLELARSFLEAQGRKVTIVSSRSFSSLPLELQDIPGLRDSGIEVRSSSRVTALEGVLDRLTRVVVETDVGLGRVDTVEADALILSAGRLPELAFVPVEATEQAAPGEPTWRTLELTRGFPGEKDEGLMASPEPGRVSDSTAVVKSILSGRRLARTVNDHFEGRLRNPPENLVCEADSILDVTGLEGVEAESRNKPRYTDVEGDPLKAWILPRELPGLDEGAARKEAERCLRCGLICYRKTA